MKQIWRRLRTCCDRRDDKRRKVVMLRSCLYTDQNRASVWGRIGSLESEKAQHVESPTVKTKFAEQWDIGIESVVLSRGVDKDLILSEDIVQRKE